MKISQNFVASSEYMNFNTTYSEMWLQGGESPPDPPSPPLEFDVSVNSIYTAVEGQIMTNILLSTPDFKSYLHLGYPSRFKHGPALGFLNN